MLSSDKITMEITNDKRGNYEKQVFFNPSPISQSIFGQLSQKLHVFIWKLLQYDVQSGPISLTRVYKGIQGPGLDSDITQSVTVSVTASG